MSDGRENRYRKIKIDKKGKVSLVWDEPIEKGGYDACSRSYHDQPLPKFQKSLNKMALHLVEICQMPEDYAKNMLVMGVAISYTDAGVRGLVIIAEKTLPNNLSVNLNSPHVPEISHSEEVDKFPILSAGCISALDKVIAQAEGYRLGDRAQMGMFPSEEESKDSIDTEQAA